MKTEASVCWDPSYATESKAQYREESRWVLEVEARADCIVGHVLGVD